MTGLRQLPFLLLNTFTYTQKVFEGKILNVCLFECSNV